MAVHLTPDEDHLASDRTRTGLVMEAVRRKITTRAVAPGERLPSIRDLARSLQVSPSTVVEAYDRLAAEGLIYARRGAGFYVAQSTTPFTLADIAPRLERAVDPLWVSRQSLEAEAGTLMPGCGWLPPSWLPQEGLRRAVRKLARREDAVLGNYGHPRGHPALRTTLARLAADEGLPVDGDQILLTGSGTQALDLVCRMLLRAGDTVLVDDPCYFNFLALLRAHRVRVVGVPYTEAGPDVAAFAAAVREHKPRLYLTNSALHNPTGATLSAATAHRVLKIAVENGLVIVEDDIFAALEPEPSPRLALLDGLESVIRVGSYSKTLSAAARCGYVMAKAAWIEALIDLQVATCFAGASPVAADLVFTTLAEGAYRRHVADLRRRLATAQRHAATRLERLGVVPRLMPRGGLFLWCRLPDGLQATNVAQAALRSGVVLAPGNVFSISQTASDLMRFNVAQMSNPRIYEVLGEAMRAAR